MKSIIMAGGEGSRLRPLTCDIPKPMASLCGRPIMEYILDLLSLHGFDEATITLKYLPNMITEYFKNKTYMGQSGQNGNISLTFVEEDKPLGTAGSVKNAAKGFNDDFLIISGDALTDFDLSAAVAFHKEKKALATILVTPVGDPREYGLVNFDDDGKIIGFIEKPGWAQAVTDFANTGIYIISAEVLKLIPDDVSFDFAKNVFPLMLQNKMPLFAYSASGYWCDIGDLNTYMSCQKDIVEGKVRCKSLPEIAGGIYCSETLPEGDYKMIPPVYIGKDVTIGDGARILANSIIEDGCYIGRGASIKGSVVHTSAYVGDKCSLTGALLCSGASVRRGASMFEGAAAGSGAIIGEGATVLPSVRIWPGKKVEDFAVVRDNLQYGTVRNGVFDDSGISGETGVEMTPELCVRIGESVGSVFKSGQIGVACGPGKSAKALKMALVSGLLMTGCSVHDFGESFEAGFNFAVSMSGLAAGIFISSKLKTSLQIVTEGGLPPQRSTERDIEARLLRGEFSRCSWDAVRDVVDMSGMNSFYHKELIAMADSGLEDMSATIKSSNRLIWKELSGALEFMGCSRSDELQLHIGTSGMRLAVFSEETGYIWPEQVLAICCLPELEQGRNIALPYDAPNAIEQLAKSYGCKVLRYLECPADGCDKESRTLAKSQPWVRDGLFMAARLLGMLKKRKCGIGDLLKQIPQFATASKIIKITGNPGNMIKNIPGALPSEGIYEGVIVSGGGGRILVKPSKRGKELKLIAEALSTEIATELCDDMQQLLDSTNKK